MPPSIPMLDRFAAFPQYLAERARLARVGDVPVMLAHPDWNTPAPPPPCVLWLHGRTAHKELDPGRFLRWLRAGIALCSIDLPGHGERFAARHQHGGHTLEMLEQVVKEIDHVVAFLRERGVFDASRLAIGGMSAGGMATLRRLCDPHPFRCAAVEGCTGSLARMPDYIERHGPDAVRRMDPLGHIETFRPIPLLALHSEADEMVPVAGIREFFAAVRPRYQAAGLGEASLRLVTWPTTGAPREHLGFGRVTSEAKTIQTEFLAAALGATPPPS
jgi:dipeptidyl aminopeptidase/acylaminoacyl peptidase